MAIPRRKSISQNRSDNVFFTREKEKKVFYKPGDEWNKNSSGEWI